MKKHFLRTILACFTIAFLSSCNEGNGSSVPIYEGMTFVSQDGSTPKMAQGEGANPLTGALPNDISTLASITPTDRPLPPAKYYFNPNQEFSIRVHLHNPSQYEIQSFTLNGVKYASYMFEEGSTLDMLVLKIKAPAESGYFEYNLSSMKYIDGTSIRDVDLSGGQNSVRVGVAHKKIPSATLSSQLIASSAAKFELDVKDPSSIAYEEDLKFHLSDGTKILRTFPLKLGKNVIALDGLASKKAYQYGVSASFDLADGGTADSAWILKETFETDGHFAFHNVASTLDTITFDLIRTEEDDGESPAVAKLSIYDAGSKTLIEEKGPEARSFSSLLSNHEYDLRCDYTYLDDGEIERESILYEGAKTKGRALPTLEVGRLESDHRAVRYEINLHDADGICSLNSVDLCEGGTTVQSKKEVRGVFLGLDSNKQYTLRVSYSYDLGDGRGPLTDVITKNVSTLAYTVPTYEAQFLNVTRHSFDYQVSVKDPDAVSSFAKVALYQEATLIGESPSLQGTFSSLKVGASYWLRVIYSYDLHDGKGKQEIEDAFAVSTLGYQLPEIRLNNIREESHSLQADIEYIDPDNIGHIESVALYKENRLVKSSPELLVSFDGLEPLTKYEVRIGFAYDLQDGKGMRHSFFSKELQTSLDAKILSARVLNTGGVTEGHMIFLEVTLDNPNALEVKGMRISGVDYPVAPGSSPEKVFIDIDGNIVASTRTIYIEEVFFSHQNKVEKASLNPPYRVDLPVMGHVEILSIVPSNAAGVPLDLPVFTFGREKYFALNLSNPSGYPIKKVMAVHNEIPETSISRIDDEHYVLCLKDTAAFTEADNIMEFIGLTYETPKGLKTMDFSYNCRFSTVGNAEPVIIHNAAEFLAMEAKTRYELGADIDLAGIDWRPFAFSGVLDGKGFAIRNLTFAGDFQYEGGMALFSDLHGLVANLTFKNASIVVNFPANNWNSNFAAFLFVSSYLGASVRNVTIDRSNYLRAIGAHYASAFGAHYARAEISDCVNEASIYCTGTAQGIITEAQGVYRCINRGTIQGDFAYGIGGSYVQDCKNYGAVTAEVIACGIGGAKEVTVRSKNFGTIKGLYGYGIDDEWVADCENHGEIIGTDNAMGIAKTEAIRSKNYGAVTAGISAAGICEGHNMLTLEDCENHGTIRAPSARGLSLSCNVTSAAKRCKNTGDIYYRWLGALYCESVLDIDSPAYVDCHNTGKLILDPSLG